jgi:DNA-binding transcriptional MerR regulator
MVSETGPSESEIGYGISELAEEFNVTLRSLRFYEQKGLLSPRREGRLRIYSRADRTRLKLILQGKRIGLSLLDIKEILVRYDANGENLEQLQLTVEKGEEQMRILERQHAEIEDAMEELEGILAGLHAEIAERQARARHKRQGPSPMHV